MSSIDDRLKNAAKQHTSYLDQMKIAVSGDIPLLISKPQLQMLLVLIENIDDLESQGLLILSDEEKAHIGELYQKASQTYNASEEEASKQVYTDQVSYLSKKRKQNGI